MKTKAHTARHSRALPATLLDPACYPHPVERVHLIETHISWVFLTGKYVYKVKKPVDLGFVDFTSLELRRRACEEELRLNRRLAAEIYLAVVEIRGTPDAPRIEGGGALLDYAVKMREFPQDALAAKALASGDFGDDAIDRLAATIAAFHARVPAAMAGRLGSPASVIAAARQNFAQILPRLHDAKDRSVLLALRRWSEREATAKRETFAARKRSGHVRECHGDLHLGNVALIDGVPVAFDGIEFSAELRWIDVMSEVAFLFMDLADRGRTDLGWRFLNRYLEASGDYAGLAVLRYYAVYRAIVRAKVHLMRAQEPGLDRAESARLVRAFRGYLRLARRLADAGGAAVLVTRGLSGSGKTTVTQPLIELLGAVRLRSDIERKRMHGLGALADSASIPNGGIYTPQSTQATYRRLADSTRRIVRAGYPVLVDATFLQRAQRRRFRTLAEQLAVPFLILSFEAPLSVLRARVAARSQRRDDASEADLDILERQIATAEPLTEAETAFALAIDASRSQSDQVLRAVRKRLPRATSRSSRARAHGGPRRNRVSG
jgi:aminoglycoside phosphotransferase family enzyme/predicted kinase